MAVTPPVPRPPDPLSEALLPAPIGVDVDVLEDDEVRDAVVLPVELDRVEVMTVVTAVGLVLSGAVVGVNVEVGVVTGGGVVDVGNTVVVTGLEMVAVVVVENEEEVGVVVGTVVLVGVTLVGDVVVTGEEVGVLVAALELSLAEVADVDMVEEEVRAEETVVSVGGDDN